MPERKQTPIQLSFTGGEVSPKVYGRFDLEAYRRSLAECVNFIPQIQGGAVKRPGTVLLGANYASRTAEAAIVPFRASDEEEFVLTPGFRPYSYSRNVWGIAKNGALQSLQSSQGAFIDYDSSGQEYADLRWAQVREELYMVSRAGDYMRKITWDGTKFTDAALGVTDLKEADEIDTSAEYQQRVVRVGGLSPATYAYYERTVGSANPSFPFLLRVPLAGGNTAFRTGAERWLAARDVHNPTHITLEVTGTNNRTVLGRVYPYFSYGSGSYQPQPGETFDVGYVYSEGGAILSSSNRPTAVGAFQDRVMLSGTPDDPDTLYGSVIADYLNFAKADLSGRVLDSSGWEFTVLSNRRNRVQWLHDGVQLLIGTTDGIYTMSGGQRGQTGDAHPAHGRSRAMRSTASATGTPASMRRRIAS